VLYAAGSLRPAFEQLLPAFTQKTGHEIRTTFGPAGLLRERIERGERADIFASANMAHPERLFAQGLFEQPACFARNRICVLARRELGLTSANLLAILLDPQIKLGTSTPEADPSGDYALAVFARAEAVRPGAEAILTAKARHLVGGRQPLALPEGRAAGEWLIATGQADIFLSYWTSAQQSAGNAAVEIIELPAELSIVAEYGLSMAAKAVPATSALARHIMSDEGQRILQDRGFDAARTP